MINKDLCDCRKVFIDFPCALFFLCIPSGASLFFFGKVTQFHYSFGSSYLCKMYYIPNDGTAKGRNDPMYKFLPSVSAYALNVPERYEKCLRVSSSVMGKSLPTPHRGESGHLRRLTRRPNESRDKDSPSSNCQRPSRRADERIEVRATTCP